jgi:predicted DNA-binding transcriptional regulator YafY
MNRIDRLLALVTFLQSKKYVTAEAIADKFSISVRTVYRDVKALCEQGIPVSFEPHKGYFIVHGFFLPPVSFSSEEANALLLMEKVMEGFADKSIWKHYSSALNKVKAVLRGPQKEQIEALSNNMRFHVPACFAPDYEYLSLLQTAIASRTVIQLEYRNNKAEISRRKVEPIGLVFYAFAWHLIGWCHYRHDYRDFKVARILKIQATTEPFTQQNLMELNDYIKALPVSY